MDLDPAELPPLRVLALNCTLKPGPAPSSTDRMLQLILGELARHGAHGEVIRVVERGVRFGVAVDEGDGDGWPGIREALLAADILVIGTPIWLGHPASVCQVVLERLDAELGETDDRGRPSMSDKVALLGVVGNEDGAHHVTAEVFQALDDVGFTIPAQAATYWVGEAMQKTDFKDLPEIPEKIRSTAAVAAANAAHLARVLRTQPLPAPRS